MTRVSVYYRKVFNAVTTHESDVGGRRALALPRSRKRSVAPVSTSDRRHVATRYERTSRVCGGPESHGPWVPAGLGLISSRAKGRSALVRVIQSLSVLAVVFAALTVSVPAAYAAGTITQAAPTSNSTTVDASTGFTDQPNATGNNGTVTYAQGSSTSALLSVSSSGAVAVTGTSRGGQRYTVSESSALRPQPRRRHVHLRPHRRPASIDDPGRADHRHDHRRRLEGLHRPAERHRQQRHRHLRPGLG